MKKHILFSFIAVITVISVNAVAYAHETFNGSETTDVRLSTYQLSVGDTSEFTGMPTAEFISQLENGLDANTLLQFDTSITRMGEGLPGAREIDEVRSHAYGTLLQVATFFCQADKVKALLVHGANPDAKSCDKGMGSLTYGFYHKKPIVLALEHRLALLERINNDTLDLTQEQIDSLEQERSDCERTIHALNKYN